MALVAADTAGDGARSSPRPRRVANSSVPGHKEETHVRPPPSARPTAPTIAVSTRLRTDPVFQAFTLLRIGFTVAPILFGLDKFANVMVDWTVYLAPWINDILPGQRRPGAMYVVGVVEILAGLAVAVRPRYGALLVAAWLGGIILNLLTYSGYYDIALRDFGLMLGALTLARLATVVEPRR